MFRSRLALVLVFISLACSSSPPTEPAKPAEEPVASRVAEQPAAPTAPASDEPQTPAAETELPNDAIPTVTFHTSSGDVVVAVEIANTQALRIKGLMFRESLEPNRGMVFVFDREVVHPFWMKNTYVSLDMIHVSSEMSVVGIVARAAPLTLERRSIEQPSRFIVEVAAGFAEQMGIGPGTRVSFAHIPTEPQG